MDTSHSSSRQAHRSDHEYGTPLQRRPSSYMYETDTKSSSSEGDCPDWTEEEEKSVIRKIDYRILPILAICYMLQLLDKQSISSASILGIMENLNLKDSQYGWATAVFYFGYLFFTYPTSVLMVKLPVGKYVSTTVIIWALVVMLHAACFNFGGLLTIRVFLGVAEATCTPAFALLVGLFYKRSEQPSRQNLWFIGQAVGGACGALSTWAITFLTGALPTWKYLFIIYGSMTVVWGAVMWFFLPDHPSTAKFLSARERSIAVARVAANGNGATHRYKKEEVVEALLDPQVWVLTLYTFAVQMANGGFGAFGLLVMSSLGFGDRTILLLQIPIAGFQLVFIVIGIIGSSFRSCTLYTMMFIISWSLIGMVMVFAIPASQPWARYGGYCLTTAYVANLPMVLSLITSNILGQTKRSTAMAMIFVSFCVGNIVGPQFFIDSEAPGYPTGMIATIVGFAIAFVFLVVLRVYYMWQNRRRGVALAVALGGLVLVDEQRQQIAGRVDGKTDRTDKSFAYAL